MSAPPISWLMNLALARPQLVSLAVGFTDNESLPLAETRALLGKLLARAKTGRAALQYGSTAGLPELRRITAQRLRDLDQGKSAPLEDSIYDPERVIITNGSQQLLYIISECLCDSGDIILVEDPTYFVYLGIAQSRALQCRGVRLKPDGVDLHHLEEVLESLKRSGQLPRLKMFYSVSYFQNPSGVTTCFEKKVALLKLLRRYEGAAGHRIYFLEDAAYRELNFKSNETEIPSALTLKGLASRVIYAGTYSKPFATGARVGFGLLPEPVYTCALRAKGNHDFGTANLLQELLYRSIKQGDYSRHLQVLQARYERKAQVMERAMREFFPPQVEWLQPTGGLYVWARLPRSVRSDVQSKLFKTALARNVLYVPGALCYSEDFTRRKPNHEMRLSFGGATEKNIRSGIQRLGKALEGIASSIPKSGQ